MFEIHPSLLIAWLDGLFDRRKHELACGATPFGSGFVQPLM